MSDDGRRDVEIHSDDMGLVNQQHGDTGGILVPLFDEVLEAVHRPRCCCWRCLPRLYMELTYARADPPRDPPDLPGADGAGDPPDAGPPPASSADVCLICCEEIEESSKFLFGCADASHCVHGQCIVDYCSRVDRPRCLSCTARWTDACSRQLARLRSQGVQASAIPEEREATEEFPMPPQPGMVSVYCCDGEVRWSPSPIFERVESLGAGFVRGVNREEYTGICRVGLLDAGEAGSSVGAGACGGSVDAVAGRADVGAAGLDAGVPARREDRGDAEATEPAASGAVNGSGSQAVGKA